MEQWNLIKRTYLLKMNKSPFPMSRNSASWVLLAATCALLLAFVQDGWAVDRTKANNTTNLNQTGSWAAGVVPTSSDVGVWDDTVTGANTTLLGGNLTWLGIRIGGTTQTGLITVNTGNTLTLGSSGIDLSSTSRNLTLYNAVTAGADQNWAVGTGRTLSFGDFATNELSGSGNVTKTGSGTLVTGHTSSSYNGTFTIESGTWYTRGNGFSAVDSAVVLKAGVTVSNLTTAIATVSGSTGNTTTHIDGNVTLIGTNGGTSDTTSLVFNRTAGTAAVNLRANAEINVSNAPVGPNLTGGRVSFGGVSESGGSFSLTKTGQGILEFNNAQTTNTTYTGGTFVNGGTLRLSAYGKLSTGGNVTINGGSTLDLNIFIDQSVGTVTLNDGNITQGTASPTRTLSATSFVMSNGSVSQRLAGANATMTKGTSGTVTLSANNTYGGGTSITAGTLLVNNSAGSGTGNGTVNVESAGILGGNGTITGTTTISGSLRPGNSIGTLTVDDDVTWNAGSNWVFELGTAGASMGSPGTSDLLNLTGAGADFLKGSGSGWTFDFGGGGAVGWYQLVNWTGTSGFSASDFAGTNFGPGLSLGSFVVDGPSTALYLEVIPEPGTMGMISLAIAAFGMLRRKRKSA